MESKISKTNVVDLRLSKVNAYSFLYSPVVRFFYEAKWHGDFIEPRRRLYDTELVFVTEGGFNLEIEGKLYRMAKHSAALIPPRAWHESRTLKNDETFRCCIHFDWLPGNTPRPTPVQSYDGEPFDPSLASAPPAGIAECLPLVISLKKHPEIVASIENACEQIRRRNPLASIMLWPAITSLLALKSDSALKPVFPGKTARLVFIVRDFIDANYSKPQSLATYAKLTSYSGSHICQAFTSMIGIPPLAYLNDIRLHHAKRLLLESSLSVKEIAQRVGIPDPNYFSRLFRRKFKKNPTRYLKEEEGD